MRKSLLLSSILLLLCAAISAQSVQYGYTEEYNGSKDKTPLSKVAINAGGATAKSDKNGKFKLEFKTLKVGDRVMANLNSVAILKNYVLFNKEALEQWTVSGKDVYFRIVLCKKKTFDNLVMTYYNVSDNFLREQLHKERENACRLKEQGEIQQQEYERLLREADDRYQNAIKHIRENAELVARIDESELEGNQAEILRLAKEGRLDEAVALIRQDSTAALLEKTVKKLEYGEEQERQAKAIQEEAKTERTKLIANLKNNIKILQLQGGKENYDLCSEYWQKIIEADTTDLINVRTGGEFFFNQHKFKEAEECFIITFNAYKKLYDGNPINYSIEFAGVQYYLGWIQYENRYYRQAEDYLQQTLSIYETLNNNGDAYHDKIANAFNILGMICALNNQYQKSEKYFLKALTLRKYLADTDSDDNNMYQYAQALNNLGTLYRYMGDYQKSEEYYL